MVVVSVFQFAMQKNAKQQITYAQVCTQFQQERVRIFAIADGKLHLLVRTQDGKEEELIHSLASVEIFHRDLGELIAQQKKTGIIEDYNYIPAWSPPWWLPYLLVCIGLVALLCFQLMRQKQAMGGAKPDFGLAKTKNHAGLSDKTTFDDVAGAKEEKEELQEIVAFLRDPTKFANLGARLPKGVLLVGPPGTGKTLISRAVAGEAGVQFLSISGSDFVELYVGIGASRVRDLFEQAKKLSPCIIFIDEIDAVGRQRGTGLGGGHDEREQTLNQLLVEMDGVMTNKGIIILAATNRQDILDPALLRPGRFDRQVYIGLPDIKGREEILRLHAKKRPLSDDVQLEEIARATAGFTGADLENLLNEASLLAAREDAKAISMRHAQEAMIKVIAGPEKKSRVVSADARRLTAYHEAGHAVVMQNLKTQDPVHQITIIPRGKAGGMTISLPTEERSYHSRTYLQETIAGLLGGRVAEKLVLGDISTGASNDIQRASDIARAMVTKYGMSEKIGTINYDSEGNEIFIGRSMGQTRNYSEAIAAEIDAEIKQIISEGYRMCEEILKQHATQLDDIAAYLLEHESMDGDTFRAILEGKHTI